MWIDAEGELINLDHVRCVRISPSPMDDKTYGVVAEFVREEWTHFSADDPREANSPWTHRSGEISLVEGGLTRERAKAYLKRLAESLLVVADPWRNEGDE